MKKRICLMASTIVCLIGALFTTVYARSYNVEGTDLKISLDDQYWYVFTRDNLQDNDELEDLGVSKEDMHDILYDNGAYLYAVSYDDDGDGFEFFIRKKNIEKITNLSNYEDDDIEALAENLADSCGAEEYGIYNTKYKFVELEYTDSDYYIREFVTVVNGENYSFTFQTMTPLNKSGDKEVEEIIDSIRFDIDEELEEDDEGRYSFDDATKDFFVGGVAALTVSGISLLVSRKKKNKKNNED